MTTDLPTAGNSEKMQTRSAENGVHIVETPGIRLLLADRMRLAAIVVLVAGIVAQLRRIVTEEPRRLGSRTAGVFPLRFGGKPHILSGLFREFVAEFRRVPLGDIVHRAVRVLG